MGIAGVSILVAGIIAGFAGVIYWGVSVQARTERAGAELAPDDAWKVSGFEPLRAQGFALFQIVPTTLKTTAEFVIQDEGQRVIGRYIGNINKSAALEYGGKTAELFIQGAPLGGSKWAGKVGGTSNDSIVIRNDRGLIAEAWRQNAVPPVHYKLDWAGETLQITTGGFSPVSLGTITRASEQIGAFRRPSLGSRNVLVALRPELPDELKACLCSLILLE